MRTSVLLCGQTIGTHLKDFLKALCSGTQSPLQGLNDIFRVVTRLLVGGPARGITQMLEVSQFSIKGGYILLDNKSEFLNFSSWVIE